MLNILAITMMTATRTGLYHDHQPRQTKVRDVPAWNAPRWWRKTRMIDPENL